MKTFKAWVDVRGSNEDRSHGVFCETGWGCHHFRLWDLNTAKRSKNIVRVVHRRRPLYFCVMVGKRYRVVLRLGRLS